ncbi:MAG: hypothetical protein P4M09_22535 [Devosia sp.]|nr:hypothetical protein [Devosia sp.]
MLIVNTPAADRTLLTIDELREATGVADASKDDALMRLGDRVATSITGACKIARAGATPPTLRQETLTETFRSHRFRHDGGRDDRDLLLARRPIVSVASVTIDGTVLDPPSYEIDASAGILRRLGCGWYGCVITAVYDAGWNEVPGNLALAAMKLATALWSESTRDPNLRRVQVEGISLREYWVPPTSDPLLSTEIVDLLVPFTETPLG